MRVHFLLVDDDRMMRELLPPILTKADLLGVPMDIETAGTPEGALELLGKAPRDGPLIVLSDHNLKARRTGIDVLASVAQARPDAVRVLFSGHARDEIHGLDEATIDGFLEKPFRLQDLIEPLREIILRALAARGPDADVSPTPRGDRSWTGSARRLENDEIIGALLQAESKGETTRAEVLYEEARRRGARADAERETLRALAWHNRILGSIAEGAPLGETLASIVRSLEAQLAGLRGAILLLENGELVEGAAPSLDPSLVRSLSGPLARPDAGPVAVAARTHSRVVTDDIRADPAWESRRDTALRLGLAACWTTPMVSPGGKLLGTISLFAPQARPPSAAELQLLEHGANLARAAIESHADRLALHRAEAKWRELYENVPAMYFTCKMDGTLQNVNRFGAHQLGYEPEELLGRSLFDLLHAEDRPRAEGEILAYAAGTGPSGPLEHRKLRRDGTSVWVTTFLHTAADGTPGGERLLLVACNDITARKDAERALRDARDRLDLALESGQTGAWDLDLVTDTSVRTPRHDQIFGYDRLERWGRAEFMSHVLPEDLPGVQDRFREAEEASTLEFTCRIRRADGALRWVHAMGRLQRDAEGKPARMLGVVTDVTRQKQDEEQRLALLAREEAALAEAKAQRERLHGLFMQAPAAIAIVEGPRHVWSFVNPRYEELVARKASELIGRAVEDLFPEAREQGFIDLLDRVRATGEPVSLTGTPVTLRRGEGSVRVYLNFVYAPVRGPDGSVASTMVHAVDVTEQVEARNEAKALAEELDERVRARTKELEDANRDLESFSYVVSHDLRAPLRAIHHLLGSVRDGLPESASTAREDLATARHSAEDLMRMTEGLLALARATRSDLHREPVDLTKVAETVAAELRVAEPTRRVEVVVAPDLHARGDPRLIRSLLENLVGNAWKFTAQAADARIEVGATRQDAKQVFFVRDNGIGFDMDRAKDLFKPFGRLHLDAGFQGSGIGLATVRRIIERHDGRVWAEGTPGAGATFYFTLPDA